MKILRYYIFFSIAFSSLSIFAQNEEKTSAANDDVMPAQKKQHYLFSPRVSVTVPHPIANKAFRKTFVGVYELSGGLNVMVFKGAFVGITYKNGLLKVFENKIADLEADMRFNNVGFKVGTDIFVGDKNRIIFSTALTAGKNWTQYSRFRCKTANEVPSIKGFTTSYLEPELNVHFLIEQNFGIGATLTYSFFNQKFNPYNLCLNEFAQFDKTNPGTIQYLSFGFGFYYSFLKK